MTTRDDWRDALAATPDCIAIERIGEPLTDAERAHVATCARCEAELALFHSFVDDNATAEELAAGSQIAAELHRRLDGAANVTAFAPRQRPLRYGWAAAAAVVLAIGAGFWLETREPALSPADPAGIYRTARLEAIAPAGDLAQAPAELRWKPVASATGYAVEILEVDRTLVWKAETDHDHIVLPAAVVARFAPGKTLLWDVQARRGSDVLASSGVQRFRVAVQVPRRIP